MNFFFLKSYTTLLEVSKCSNFKLRLCYLDLENYLIELFELFLSKLYILRMKLWKFLLKYRQVLLCSKLFYVYQNFVLWTDCLTSSASFILAWWRIIIKKFFYCSHMHHYIIPRYCRGEHLYKILVEFWRRYM